MISLLLVRTVNNCAAYLKDCILPHMSILDVGCGSGSMIIDFARRVPQGHAVGLDTEVAATTLSW